MPDNSGCSKDKKITKTDLDLFYVDKNHRKDLISIRRHLESFSQSVTLFILAAAIGISTSFFANSVIAIIQLDNYVILLISGAVIICLTIYSMIILRRLEYGINAINHLLDAAYQSRQKIEETLKASNKN